MKRILVALFAMTVLYSCPPAEPAVTEPAVTFPDGTFRAEADSFRNGWKNFVEVTVTNGKITAVTIDAMAEAGGPTKDQLSREGGYKMVELGGAIAEWHEQADIVEAWLLANQAVTAPDAITGATISYGNYFELAAKALNVAP